MYSSDWNCLHWAVQKENYNMVKILIEKHGFDVNSKSKLGLTPLHIACCHNNIEMVKLLVEKGADVNARDNDGDMPIDYADTMEYLEIINFLFIKK